MNKKYKDVKLPDYTQNTDEELQSCDNKKEFLDEVWDGETVDEEKN